MVMDDTQPIRPLVTAGKMTGPLPFRRPQGELKKRLDLERLEGLVSG